MKINKLFAGTAMMLLMASCASDEPATTPAVTDDNGSTMYLSINISDANSARSRADESTSYYDHDGKTSTGNEGDYVFGDAKEHDVYRADFLFYDRDGRFVTRANVWDTANATEVPNVEAMGKHTLVLRNLTKKNLPEYVITVLNAPEDFARTVELNNWDMEQTRMQQMNIVTKSENTEYFIMSTTSFFNGDDTDTERYEDVKYYATKLKATDFLTEVPTAEAAESSRVEIYVERLAAKFQLKGLDANAVKTIQITLAGEDNNANGNVEGVASASTNVYVKILGYGLTAQEKKSYLSKNIDGLKNDNGMWATWNDAPFFRSYWAKSLGYDSADSVLKYTTFPEAKNNPAQAIYGYETTRALNIVRNNDKDKKLYQNRVTNLLITARVYSDEACTKPLDLVEFNGVYFKKDQYVKYVLGKLLAGGKLQFWTNEQETGTKTITEETPEGTVTREVTTYKYDALDAADFTWAKADIAGTTGVIVVKFAPLDANVKLYKKGANWKEGDRLVEATAAELNAQLANFNESSYAHGFNGGSMFYSIPVEHLLGKNLNSSYKVDAVGEYGIVRNHWYEITVDKVMHLGQGVFQPGDIEGSEETEELIPNEDDDKERFALSAAIRVLSWKIVRQSVDL